MSSWHSWHDQNVPGVSTFSAEVKTTPNVYDLNDEVIMTDRGRVKMAICEAMHCSYSVHWTPTVAVDLDTVIEPRTSVHAC